MTPQERDLIESVFERLARAAGAPKDQDALALIRERAAQQPDAVYGLVQAVLVQEVALNQATARMAELERQLEQATQGQAAQPAAGFLPAGSPWSSGRGPRPAAAYQAAPATPPPPSSGPWGAPVGGASYAPAQPASPGPWGAPAGGGFLRNVATMAAGVAGGTLLADGIASLFGGHHMFGGYGGGLGGAAGPWGGQPEVVENFTTVNNYDDRGGVPDQGQDAGYQDAGYQDAGYQDAGAQDASFDDSSFDSGDFDSGFDSSDT